MTNDQRSSETKRMLEARALKRGVGYQPKTGTPCDCRPGVHRDNCPLCEGTGMRIDFAAIRARRGNATLGALVAAAVAFFCMTAICAVGDQVPDPLQSIARLVGRQ